MVWTVGSVLIFKNSYYELHSRVERVFLLIFFFGIFKKLTCSKNGGEKLWDQPIAKNTKMELPKLTNLTI